MVDVPREGIVETKKRLFAEVTLAQFASGQSAKSSGDAAKDKENAMRLAVALDFVKDELAAKRPGAESADKQELDNVFAAANTLQQRTLEKFSVTAAELENYKKKTIEPELIKMNVALVEIQGEGLGGGAGKASSTAQALLQQLGDIHKKIFDREMDLPGRKEKPRVRPGIGNGLGEFRDDVKLPDPSDTPFTPGSLPGLAGKNYRA